MKIAHIEKGIKKDTDIWFFLPFVLVAKIGTVCVYARCGFLCFTAEFWVWYDNGKEDLPFAP